jgi:hypothetical protein
MAVLILRLIQVVLIQVAVILPATLPDIRVDIQAVVTLRHMVAVILVAIAAEVMLEGIANRKCQSMSSV